MIQTAEQEEDSREEANGHRHLLPWRRHVEPGFVGLSGSNE
jgi:hypothetical protein